MVVITYEGVSKCFRTDHLERELQMVQLFATRCGCIAILWVNLVNFAAITLCDPFQRVFVVLLLLLLLLFNLFISLWFSPETLGYNFIISLSALGDRHKSWMLMRYKVIGDSSFGYAHIFSEKCIFKSSRIHLNQRYGRVVCFVTLKVPWMPLYIMSYYIPFPHDAVIHPTSWCF
jgi:hypothetical protein